MTESKPKEATVLVVDDEPDLADLYADYLDGEYEVHTAYGGEAALDVLGDPNRDIDVTLLDRRMPDLSGDEVLASIAECDSDVRVAMITAVNPGFDLIDMGCDEYLVKPVSRLDLLEVVERLLKLSEYSEKHQELTSKKLTRNVLKVEKNGAELTESDQYARLTAEIEALESELDDISRDLEVDDLQRHI